MRKAERIRIIPLPHTYSDIMGYGISNVSQWEIVRHSLIYRQTIPNQEINLPTLFLVSRPDTPKTPLETRSQAKVSNPCTM